MLFMIWANEKRDIVCRPMYILVCVCVLVCVRGEIKLVRQAKSIAGYRETWPIKHSQVNIS